MILLASPEDTLAEKTSVCADSGGWDSNFYDIFSDASVTSDTPPTKKHKIMLTYYFTLTKFKEQE